MAYEFYREHLSRVSRSFAFCIDELNSPLREFVAHMYLMCRIVDTAEDYPWKEIQNRKVFFQNLRTAIEDPHVLDVAIKDELFLQSIKPEELLLLGDMNKLLRIFHGFKKVEQEIIKDLLISMMGGMEFFLQNHKKDKNLYLGNLRDVNKYCFYVAGIVGEALSRLAEQASDFVLNSKTLIQSYHFGLFLQKINLLKDYHSDLLEGRNLVFNYQVLRTSLSLHAREAIGYIKTLGDHCRDYKIFCGWSLFLGLASLPYIDRSYKSKKNYKIPRFKTLALIRKVESIIEDNSQLESFFNIMLSEASLNADRSYAELYADRLEDSLSSKFDLTVESCHESSFKTPAKLTDESSGDSSREWTTPYRGRLGVSDMQRLVSC